MKPIARALAITGCLLQATAHAAVLHFTTPLGLSGSQQVPVNVSGGSGNGTVNYDTTTLMLDVHLDWNGLSGAASAAHIHCCSGPGANSAVAINFVPAGFPASTAGSFDHSFDLSQAISYGGGFLGNFNNDVNAARNAFVAGLSADLAYFNIHDQLFPGGEIRGDIAQMHLPVPGSVALLGLGLVLGALVNRGS